MNIQILVDGLPLLNDFTPFDVLFPRINGIENIMMGLEVREGGIFLDVAGCGCHYIKQDQKLTFEFKPGA